MRGREGFFVICAPDERIRTNARENLIIQSHKEMEWAGFGGSNRFDKPLSRNMLRGVKS